MKKKIKKTKFIRNIIIGLVSLIIVAYILNIAPGYRRDVYKDRINLIIDDENVTENLKNKIYINEKGSIYFSLEDTKNLFDKNLYYDGENNQVITTSYTKVANIIIGEKHMTVNDTEIVLSDAIIEKDGITYLPISELSLVYSIKVDYIEKTNVVIIDSLEKGLITANVTDNLNLKFKPRGLSKDIGTAKKGEKVYCFYTTSKGWRQIRTEYGILGYVKANKLANEYILRQDMGNIETGKKLNKDNLKTQKDGKEVQIEIKNLFKIISQNNIELEENAQTNSLGNSEIWAQITNNLIEEYLQNYKTRTAVINTLIEVVVNYNIKGINIDFKEIKDNQAFTKFIIELTPRLRETGVATSLTLNKNIKEADFESIVDYFIK